jgi:ADP-heptose:LPS heptosyltransferase
LQQKTQHIAIIRLSAMGDVAMTVPVILALTKQYPKVKVTVVSRPFFKPLFNRIPNVKFLSVHTKHQHKGLLGLFRLYQELKNRGVTQIADLHNVLRSKIIRTLFIFSGKKAAFTDKGRKEKTALTRFKNKDFKPLKSMFERHVETFQKLGYTIDLNNPSFLEKGKIPQKAIDLVGEKKEQWIGIAPFAQHQRKVYPLDLMQKVIEQLSQDSNSKILLLGGGEHEKEMLDKMTTSLKKAYNLAGVISFDEELDLISNLDLMVSMDSGNAHLAAMFGVNTITLWGATHPYAGFSPYNQPVENCLVSDREKFPLLPTSVYGNKKVAGYEEAMRTISVEKIVDSIQAQLIKTEH